MQNIFSFNVLTEALTMTTVVDLYTRCQTYESDIYLYRRGASHKVESLSGLVSFLLMLKDRYLLFLIQGVDAKQVKEALVTFFVHRQGNAVLLEEPQK